MPSRRPKPRSKTTRLRAQTKAIRWVNGFVLCLLAVSAGGLAVASAMPQKRQLAAKKIEQERILEQEQAVLKELEDAKAQYEALRSDPEYLELHARDRLNLYRKGESIYRIERDR